MLNDRYPVYLPVFSTRLNILKRQIELKLFPLQYVAYSQHALRWGDVSVAQRRCSGALQFGCFRASSAGSVFLRCILSSLLLSSTELKCLRVALCLPHQGIAWFPGQRQAHRMPSVHVCRRVDVLNNAVSVNSMHGLSPNPVMWV